MSNSAYADQRVYGGDIANISNSPFTDERRQGGGGGGVPGDGTGNVQYDIANQTLNTRLAEVNTIIPDINQGASGFVIGNNVGSLNFDATDATVKLTSSLADVNLQAQEIVRTQGIKGAKMEAGFDLSTGLYENEIDMTLDTAEAKVQIKSEGTSGENTVRLTTTSSAPTQAGSVNLSLFSTASPLVSDRLVMAIEGVVENPPNNSPAWFTVVGETISQQFRSFDLFSNQVRFRNFSTMSFAGGTVNPIYEFKPDQFYRFNNDPTATGEVLKVTGGAGEDDDPWEMEWSPESGGGGGLGNVIYDGRLNVDNGTGSTVITNIDYNDSPLTIENNGGGITLNALLDSTTLRGDALLELVSLEGNVQIDADADINLNATNKINIESLLGDVSIASNNNIDIDASFGNVTLTMGSQTNPSTGVYNNDSYKNTAGDLFAWRNRASNTGAIIGGFKMTRDSNGDELLICDSISTFSFAGNSDAITTAINPIIRFNQLPNTPCSLRFDNAPQGIGNILTVTGGNGGTSSPYELNWQAPASGGGDVNYNTVTTQFENDTTPITRISLDNENFIRAQVVTGSSETLQIQSVGPTATHAISLFCNRTSSPGSSFQLQDGASGFGASARFRIGNPSNGPWFDVGASVNSTVEVSGMTFSGTQVQGLRNCTFSRLDYVSFIGSSALIDQAETSLVWNRFTDFNRVDEQAFYRFTNTPNPTFTSSTYSLKCTPVIGPGGTASGSRLNPFQLEWTEDTSGGGALNTLDITYDQENSVLVLSDPVDGVISTTTVVPGRTVLVEDVTVNGTTELSALGLSNSIFPPPLQGQPGYFDGLIGNSPPRVSLNPATGLTNWFRGASFRATLSGEIVNIGGYDDIILRVYSNRGQASQNILNSFRMVTRSVSPPPKVGFKWTIDFTCRSVNDGGILGVLATSSQFDYTDDTYVLETLGAIVNNTNSSFDTSVEQFLDFTIEFDYYNNSNNIKTTLATIERIF